MVRFSEGMDQDSVMIEVDGAEGALEWEGNTLIFIPNGGLEYGTEYEVTISGSDKFGNGMDVFTHSFSTFTIVVDDVVDDEPVKEGMGPVPIIIGAVAISLLSGIAAPFLIMRKRIGSLPEEE
jgi:hypothetical protein